MNQSKLKNKIGASNSNEEMSAGEITPDKENAPEKEKETPSEQVVLESVEPTLEQRLEELNRSNEQLRDQLLRAVAEFENYKKRRAIDLENLIVLSTESIISDLLPILDDLDRLVSNSSHGELESLIEGARLIRQKLFENLKRRGLEEIDAVGEKFNPELHEALMQLPSAEMEPETVIEVHEKGYKLGGKLLRPCRVIVAAAKE